MASVVKRIQAACIKAQLPIIVVQIKDGYEVFPASPTATIAECGSRVYTQEDDTLSGAANGLIADLATIKAAICENGDDDEDDRTHWEDVEAEGSFVRIIFDGRTL